ncbi:short-chain dehydrogenase/reductase SDR [Nitzschia inconspicua]|uniref:Short-chain dehydrogenase/reductase SDR n=1 Tax=Nitzschia inconspicua TaxID=303405 RepID=A0A9K3KP24_9STRA|nr:short-chain dehydrogenase/reductase SDR [Nitzschia inconspicua]
MMINIVRNAVAAAGAACALALVSTMDANPSLYLFDMLVVNDQRLKQYFHGKTIWITGSSSGIGAELARQISRYGVRNLILTGRSEERLQAVADGCFATDGIGGDDVKTRDMTTISILPLDMSASVTEFQQAIDRLQNILGENQLDCVILNAGTGQLQPAFQTSYETTETIFQVNTLAPITICQILLERGILRQDKGRHIVVTSSIGAKIGVPLSASYAGSKWALHGYLNSLQAEIPWLRIDLVCPGPVDTHFHSNRPMDHSTKEKREVSGTDDVITKSSKKQLKMSVERCTRLYLSSLILQSGGEHWIAEQPTLLGLYINQYFPSAFQKVLNKIGPLRVQAWQDGKDLYDPDTWKNMGQKKK